MSSARRALQAGYRGDRSHMIDCQGNDRSAAIMLEVGILPAITAAEAAQTHRGHSIGVEHLPGM